MNYQDYQPNQGHIIFQNQPPSSYFDKLFQESSDALYLHLNEIDPYFLNESFISDEAHSDAGSNGEIIDPRLKKGVEVHEYNHTDDHCVIELFESPLNSCLNQKQHSAGLRVMQAWQQRVEVEHSDFQTWLKMARYVQAERQRMKKYVEDYAQKHKAIIYKCTKRLVTLYQQWYAIEVNNIISRYPQNIAYNTKVGLPNVYGCKPLEDDLRARVSDIRILARAGYVRVYSELEINYKVLSIKLETYAQKYVESLQKRREEYFDSTKIKNYLEQLQDREAVPYEEIVNCHLPLETLLFLLVAGEFIDLPTEVLLRIESNDNERKCIYFDNPLPARNCGWNTHQQVVQQAHLAQLSLDSKVKWLRFENNKASSKKENLEIKAFQETSDFKAENFDEFMQRYFIKRGSEKETMNCLKTNENLISWKLETYKEQDADEAGLSYIQMLTNIDLPAAQTSQGQQFYSSDDIKLEYKATMGCEVLTKYELLKLWWKLRLSESSSNHEPLEGFCTRLSAENFELMLKESLTRGQIEQYLFEQCHLRMPQLLAKLYEFLKMLSNMNPGHYMLKFNTKYAEKLLLCAPSEEINTNTIWLHNLLHTTPSDICFMTAGNVNLPLAENLCSKLHCKHNILPCTFPPATNAIKSKKKISPKTVFFNDRDLILQRVEQVQKVTQVKKAEKSKRNKTAKKAKKRKEKRAQKQQEVQEEEEFEQEIINDQILFDNY